MAVSAFGLSNPFPYSTSSIFPSLYGQPPLNVPFGGFGTSPYGAQPIQQILQTLQILPQQLQQLQQLQFLQHHQLQQLQQIVQYIAAQLMQLQQLIQFVPQQIQQTQQQPFGQVPSGAPWGISPQLFGVQPGQVM